ncbi:MAG: hypothetical protein E2598_05565 [Sphingobium sp.]|nr:hypothetical protein [Sphingobium sp.]
MRIFIMSAAHNLPEIDFSKLLNTEAIKLSNANFINNIFTELPEGVISTICTKPGDPGNGGWFAQNGDDIATKCLPKNNNYFNCSSFRAGEGGGVYARKENFHAYHTVVFDDVGTKVPRGALGELKPSWELETSTGNYQVGIILDPPLTDAAQVKALQDAIIAKGLCDPGANGVARWARLPEAINGKPKYMKDNQPFRCKLTAWNPDVRMSMEALAKALDLNLAPAPKRTLAPAAQKATTAFEGNAVYSPKPVVNPVIAALMEKGWYKGHAGEGRHDISCPWVSEHTDQIDNGSTYFEPSFDFPEGGFKCHHSHGDKYKLRQLLAELKISSAAARCKAMVKMDTGDQYLVNDAMQRILAAPGDIYHAEGQLVRVTKSAFGKAASVKPLAQIEVLDILSEHAVWLKYDARSKGYKSCGLDDRLIRMVMQAGNYPYLPQLNCLAHQPFLRPDRSLVMAPGYDVQTGIYADFDPALFPVPDAPTRDDAMQAMGVLERLLCEFHFASQEDKAAAYSMLLTGAIRSGLPVAPAFNITASNMGTGKSLLAQIAALFAGAAPPFMGTYPTSQDEARKLTTSAFRDQPHSIIFDDMKRDWIPYGPLNKMLTSETVSDRLLGSSRNVTVNTRALIIGTGNNIAPIDDMARRVVTIRIEPASETPSTLVYQGTPLKTTKQNREKYVSAALTIVRAYIAAGTPQADVSSIATYDDWNMLCRHSLIWLGKPDPAQSLFNQLKEDPERQLFGLVMQHWHEQHGSSTKTVREILEPSHNYLSNDALSNALEDLMGTNLNEINRTKFGQMLGRHRGQVMHGLKIEQVNAGKGRTAWRVIEIANEN